VLVVATGDFGFGDVTYTKGIFANITSDMRQQGLTPAVRTLKIP
jgi:hypothetical protein